MAAIRQYIKCPTVHQIAFVLAGSGALVHEFIPGKCICKRCKSTKLEYNTYLEDAKCDSCAQWQQQEPIPM